MGFVMQTETVKANGLEFHCLSAGEGPLLLCMHGFPDTPHSFVPLMERMSAQGYRVVAPFMRGYAPTSIQGPYQPAAFGQDVLGLIEALGYEKGFVYGHDWGTAAAYGAAVLGPDRVEKMIAASVPYGSGMSKALITDPAQQRRSWYVFFFQTPLADISVPLEDFVFIERLWRDWSPGWDFPAAMLAEAQAALAKPGVLGAALSYYRNAMNPALRDEALAALEQRIGTEPIAVPSLYVHGATDGCIAPGVADGMQKLFSGPFDRLVLDGVGHFVHAEDPDRFATEIAKFLES